MCECELLKLSDMIYIFSLGFQMAGAMILIIKYFSNARNTLLKEYFYGNMSVEQYIDATDEVQLKRDKLQECAIKIYDNRASFIYIFLGYVLSIFGNASETSNICVLFFVIVCMTILIVFEKIVTRILAKLIYSADKIVKMDDLGELSKEIICFVRDEKKPQ